MSNHIGWDKVFIETRMLSDFDEMISEVKAFDEVGYIVDIKTRGFTSSGVSGSVLRTRYILDIYLWREDVEGL